MNSQQFSFKFEFKVKLVLKNEGAMWIHFILHCTTLQRKLATGGKARDPTLSGSLDAKLSFSLTLEEVREKLFIFFQRLQCLSPVNEFQK